MAHDSGCPMTLWNFQERAVDQLRDAIREYGSALYVGPTGSGKTVIAGEIARLASAKGRRTLLLVHRRELVKQSLDTLASACPGLEIGVEAPGWTSVPWAPLQVASVYTLARRGYDIEPDIIMVDEAHHARAATWTKVLARYPNAKLIGLTATPERLDGKGLGAHFATMVMGPSIKALVAQSHLAPTRTLRIPQSIRLDGLKRNRSGDYQKDELGKRVTDRVVADAVSAYMRYAWRRPAIFFGIDRAHSQRVCEGLRAEGIRAEHVDGDDTSGRRDHVIGGLRSGAIQVVGNCDLISEGFDAPGCEVVMLGAHTSSVTRYLQAAGRPMRWLEGKEALCLDLAGISYELGLPDELREWSLEDGEVKDRKQQQRHPHECAQCATVFYGQTCPHCQYRAPQAEVEAVETELVVAQPRPVRSKPVPKVKRAELWSELAAARRAPDVRRAVEDIGRKHGYKPSWAGYILRAWGK